MVQSTSELCYFVGGLMDGEKGERSRRLIKYWHEFYAPGLEPQPIPREASVEGLIEPLIPFGLQYRVVMPDGTVYPRHQSGPGATVVVTDGQRLVLKEDYRQESGVKILKCCGGFAGKKISVAAEMAAVYNLLPQEVVVGNDGVFANLRDFIRELLRREYNNFPLEDLPIRFQDRPIGNPNIRICSIMGVVTISAARMDAWQWPMVVDFATAKRYCDDGKFGDENTYRIVKKVIA